MKKYLWLLFLGVWIIGNTSVAWANGYLDLLQTTLDEVGPVDTTADRPNLSKQEAQTDPTAYLYNYSFQLPDSEDGFTYATMHYLEDLSPAHLPLTAGSKLDITVTPGEYEPASFVVYAQQDLGLVNVSVSDLYGAANATISGDAVEKRLVKWQLRREFHKSPPEDLVSVPWLLEAYDPFLLSAGQYRQVWLTLQVPDQVSAGDYSGVVTLAPENAPAKEIPFVVHVLPFKLDPSRKKHSIYYVSENSAPPTYEQKLRDYEDMRAHGLQHIIAKPPVYYRFVAGDSVPEADLSVVEKEIRLMQQYGFGDPYVVAARLDDLWEQVNGDAARYVAAGRKLMQAITALENEMGVDIVLTHMDEVLAGDKRDRYEELVRPLVGIPGAEFYMTMSLWRSEQDLLWLDPMVDIRSYAGLATDGWLVRGHTFDEMATYANPESDRIWVYYNAHHVGVVPHWQRVINGVYLWMSPYEMNGMWKYRHKMGDLFDDTDGVSRSTGMAFYDPRDPSGERVLYTRDWEAYREGIDDLRYISTLERLITEKAATAPQAAQEARSYLVHLMQDWWPQTFVNGYKDQKAGGVVKTMTLQHPPRSMDTVRRELAGYIMKLGDM